MERRTHRGGVARASRLAVAAEVERQNSKSCLCERASLLLPALFVETASMSQDEASAGFSVNISVDDASVLGRKGDGFLRGGHAGKGQRQNKGNECTHAGNLAQL